MGRLKIFKYQSDAPYHLGENGPKNTYFVKRNGTIRTLTLGPLLNKYYNPYFIHKDFHPISCNISCEGFPQGF